MKLIRVTFSNKDQIVTRVNRTYQEVCSYYLGCRLNLGSTANNMQTANKLEFLSATTEKVMPTAAYEGENIIVSATAYPTPKYSCSASCIDKYICCTGWSDKGMNNE